MNTVKIEKLAVKMTAHRGVSGLETENTAAAFIAAGQRTYFGIETDIHKTADGHFICCHDSNIERVSGDNAFHRSKTSAFTSAPPPKKGDIFAFLAFRITSISAKNTANIALPR